VGRSALLEADSSTVDFLERAPTERLTEVFESLGVDSTG
jgi:hypothetical protein